MTDAEKQALDEIKALVAAKNEQVDSLKTEVESLKNASTEAEKVKSELEAAKNELSDLKEKMETLATEAEKSKKSVSEKKVSFGEAVKGTLEANLELLKQLKDGNNKSEMRELNVQKAAGTMTLANYTGGTALTDELDPGITPILTRQPFILNLVNAQPTTSNTIRYVQKKNRDGGAAVTAEGAAKSQADFDLVESTATVKKVTAYIKVSKEMLDDIDFIAGEINGELKTLVDLEVDEELLGGANLTGLADIAVAFDAGTFAGTVDQANKMDVLRVAIAQIAAAHMMPNFILMHPNDVASMDLVKTTDGVYVIPPFRSANGMVLKATPIVENTGVTAGTYYVGDFTKLNVKVRERFVLSIGHDSDDFIKNLVTILGETRLVSYFKDNYSGAFVTGTFADDMVDLETV